MTRPKGALQRKPKKWTHPNSGKDINYISKASSTYWEVERTKRLAELERYNSLCGPVTITYISK